MIASTNSEVKAISAEVRSRLRRKGLIAHNEIRLKAVTPSGHGQSLALAAGDKIRFLIRAQLSEREVVNGTEAYVEHIESEGGVPRIFARIGEDRFSFTPEQIADEYGRAKLGYAYATTIYSCQGLTTDHSLVLLSPTMDRHGIYVAASRARDNSEFFVDRRAVNAQIRADLPLSERSAHKEFDDDQRLAFLAERLSRSGLKQTTIDILAAGDAKQAVLAVDQPPETTRPQRGRRRGIELE